MPLPSLRGALATKQSRGGILASMVDFSFSCCGFFFSGGSGLSRGEARRRRRAWRALDGPEPPNMGSRARRSAGVGEIAPTAWISAFHHEFRLWLFRSFDPGPSLSGVLVDSRNNLTFSRRVSATAPFALSQAVGSRGESPLRYGFSGPAIHRFAHPDRPRLIGPRRIREKTPRGGLSAPGRPRRRASAQQPSITTPASTYRHSATSSARASATTIFFFCSLVAPLVRSAPSASAPSSADGLATTKPIGSSSGASGDCPSERRPVRDRSSRSSTAFPPIRRKRRAAGDC